jgi:hypothetical protein
MKSLQAQPDRNFRGDGNGHVQEKPVGISATGDRSPEGGPERILRGVKSFVQPKISNFLRPTESLQRFSLYQLGGFENLPLRSVTIDGNWLANKWPCLTLFTSIAYRCNSLLWC